MMKVDQANAIIDRIGWSNVYINQEGDLTWIKVQ
jgi:hypothetical protein